MYINTGVGKGWAGYKVYVSAYSEKRIELTIFKPEGRHNPKCMWCSVSLTTSQAIKVANSLQNPPCDKWVDFADPDPPPAPQGEMRPMWDVFLVKHSNGVHEGSIGIAKGKIAIDNGNFQFPKRSCQTDYFSSQREEELSSQEIKKLAGLLYHWAGANLIGLATRKRKSIKVLPLVDVDEENGLDSGED